MIPFVGSNLVVEASEGASEKDALKWKKKRYALTLLSKCLVSTLLPIGSKVPPTPRYPL